MQKEISPQISQAAEDAPPITRIVAEMGQRFRFADLPAEVITVARHCFLDWVGVTLAGSQEPATSIIREELLEQGGNPQTTLLGSAQKTSMLQAALINGTASHALDFDDFHSLMGSHPSVPVFPALLALSEVQGLNGRDFITAFVAGFETECCISSLVAPSHYAMGWHTTATVGTFGTAAACAHALRLNGEQWLHALGIAGTQAAGLKAMFGTMCKPFHAGKAAYNGLLAARLAARGFTANTAILECPQGFGATQTTTYAPDEALKRVNETIHIRDVLFKNHASCYFTHSSIEGILRLKERHRLTPDQVQAIRLRVSPVQQLTCNIYEPQTPLEGKFSLRFTAALALANGDISNRAFTSERMHDPALLAIRDRVSVEVIPAFEQHPNTSEVILTLTDGSELREAVNMDLPEADLDRQWQRLVRKFRGLAAPVLGEERAELLIQAIGATENAAMTEITALCRPGA
jgi:2-methylcitrate dehydratase PrpD